MGMDKNPNPNEWIPELWRLWSLAYACLHSSAERLHIRFNVNVQRQSHRTNADTSLTRMWMASSSRISVLLHICEHHRINAWGLGKHHNLAIITLSTYHVTTKKKYMKVISQGNIWMWLLNYAHSASAKSLAIRFQTHWIRCFPLPHAAGCLALCDARNPSPFLSIICTTTWRQIRCKSKGDVIFFMSQRRKLNIPKPPLSRGFDVLDGCA